MVWRLAFAVLLSSSGVMIMVAWLTGAESNPSLTAAILAVPALIMIAAGRDARVQVNAIDVLFAAFVVSVLCSTAINVLPSVRDGALLVLSLLAYAAGRTAPVGAPIGPLLIVTLLVVGIGTMAVGISLIDQWGDPHGKPIVFGFNHAATVFLTSLGFLLFAAICFEGIRPVWAVGVAAAPAFIIFAASQVRFTFVAIAGGLVVSVLISRGPRRYGSAVILCVLVASITIGLAVRANMSGVFLKYVITSAPAPDAPPNPRSTECRELDNSIAIRKTLLRHSVQALPSAGAFGGGLGSFARVSCLHMDPHNTVLQAIIEFGWTGGLLLVAMLGVAFWCLWPLAVLNSEAAFVLCSLVYVALIDLAHGHLVSENLLFLFAGYAARITAKPYSRPLANP